MQTVCIARVKEVHLIGVGLDTHWKRSHVWYISSLLFVICANQEDIIISDWGGAPT